MLVKKLIFLWSYRIIPTACKFINSISIPISRLVYCLPSFANFTFLKNASLQD